MATKIEASRKKDPYDEAISRLVKRMGSLNYPTIHYEEFLGRTNEVASKDAIRHFCNSVGDINPLYRDPSYATNTKYGEIIAPAFFLNAIYPAQGKYESHWRHSREGILPYFMPVSGHKWEWFQPIRMNDEITVTLISPLELNDLSGGHRTRYFQQIDRITYMNKKGVVAICDVEAMYTEALESKNLSSEVHDYTEKELQEIQRVYESEEIRGANPRYWDEVNEGEKLPTMVKGPLTYTDMVAFFVGVGWNDQAFACKNAMLNVLPEAGHWADNGVGERVCQVHLIHEIAKKQTGLPKAFDFGLQRGCWFGHLISNWMGDEGFLKYFKVKWTGFNFIGDTAWLDGTVAKKYVNDNENLIDLDMWAVNQNGDRLSDTAKATIVLPTRPK